MMAAKTIRAAAALLCLLPAVAPSCRRVAKTPAEELHIGYMICNSLQETRNRFEPMNSYLSDIMGVKVIPHYVNTFEFEKEARKGYFSVAHTNSLLYVILHENLGWKLQAGEKEGSHGSRTAGVIFVAKDSPIRTLVDLKGKRMMFGPELAPMGFLSQYHMLLESGIDPELDLGYYAFTRGAFTHEKVVYAVIYGGFDAGAVPLLDLEIMERDAKIQKEDVRIIATGEFLPYCTFSTAPGLPERTRAALEKALLGLTGDATARVEGEVLNVLGRAGVDGYEKLEESDYDPLRKMARRVNMPPYQKY